MAVPAENRTACCRGTAMWQTLAMRVIKHAGNDVNIQLHMDEFPASRNDNGEHTMNQGSQDKVEVAF